MKICFFIGFYPEIVGGAEFQARLIANGLSSSNEIIFISYGHTKNEIAYVDGFKLYRLKISMIWFHKFTFYYFFSKNISKIISKEKPDLLYQRILNSFSSHLAKWCFKHKIPFVLHIADDKCLIFNLNSLSSIVRKFLFQRLLMFKPKFICQTKTQAGLLKQMGQSPVLIVPNYHPIDDIEFKTKSRRKRIVWVANVRPFKNLELFAEMASRLKIYENIEFHVIGSIPTDKYGAKLLRLLNISNIVYHGKQSNVWINNFLSESLLLVNTSFPSTEGFPNTFIQSWITGTPVISLSSDPNNYIADYGLGVYCLGNVNTMEDKIIYYSKMLNLDYQKISSKCINFAVKEFSFDNTINKINIYIKSLE